MHIIARIKNDYTSKFAIPRQSGICKKLKSEIIFEPKYRNPDALKGLEEYSHLWIIWNFSEAERSEWSPTVRPPRLGGNKRVGVFATRSPFRPNPIGLSCVRLEEIRKTPDKGCVLIVSGADLMNGTPIYDIKPYLSYADSQPDAVCGFADDVRGYELKVELSDKLLSLCPEEKREDLITILKNDPRPSYHDNPERVYGFEFGGLEIKFSVRDDVLTVVDISKV